MMEFVDTHCHIHFKDYGLDADQVWQEAQNAGVTKMLAVGCDIDSSVGALELARRHKGIYPVVGVHPHYASQFLASKQPKKQLNDLITNEVVAIGEFGLDYFYENSDRPSQIELLKLHLELVTEHDLPACFHIRGSKNDPSDAFVDFWRVFDKFNRQKPIRGVVHSFTATEVELHELLKRGLYVAFNGIMTFTRDEKQLQAAKVAPLDRMLLETDAPYLTPKPFRGKICKPVHVINTATGLASLRGESLETLSKSTTNNAKELFNLK